GEQYKIELLEGIPEDEITVYQDGEFTDLCRGPHISSTGKAGAFKLLKVAGAYWRGDEKRPMLQRIYGTAFLTQADLDKHLLMLEEAEKRDHRKLGKELELFSVFDEAGAGLIYYHPKGAMLKHIIEDFTWNENIKRGYQHVQIPHMAKGDLWKRSGHLDYYKENMYFCEVDEQQYVIKPMNCPGHILIYESKTRSYRDLPLRLAEFGTVYRYERSGVLHGLLRVRGFTQDDAHIFCTPEQLEKEICAVLEYADFMMKTFGFEYEAYLSTRPEKSVGSSENWEKATEALKQAMEKIELKYVVDPGEGVFYGPKIDIKFKDAIGRTWQGPTVQVDFNLPERFNLSYIAEDGQKHRPVMIHRVVLGSFERFMGALIENYAGAFPLWLSPVQVKILTISDAQMEYAEKVASELRLAGFRVETDYRNEKIGHKIREAQMQKTPYMLVIGKKEAEANAVAVRERKAGDQGVLAINDFIARIREEVASKV
ncbi:MAG: threonine--tRNA ligase, partial [Candidatus Margulisiibacteriota bacterium]